MTDAPYNDYVDKVLSGIEFVDLEQYRDGGLGEAYQDPTTCMDRDQLRELLADAWMAGLAYSLNLIETETKHPLRTRLRDEPKSFQGGTKLTEPILYEGCR